MQPHASASNGFGTWSPSATGNGYGADAFTSGGGGIFDGAGASVHGADAWGSSVVPSPASSSSFDFGSGGSAAATNGSSD